jgi:hypothetical protein
MASDQEHSLKKNFPLPRPALPQGQQVRGLLDLQLIQQLLPTTYPYQGSTMCQAMC